MAGHGRWRVLAAGGGAGRHEDRVAGNRFRPGPRRRLRAERRLFACAG